MAASNHTIVCGLEGTSLRLASALLQLRERVTILAESPDPELLREARRFGANVVEGRSSDLAWLRAAGLEASRCIVLAEDDDMSNLRIALSAREVNPRIRIVLRMFDADLAERTAALLDNCRVISTSAEAAPHFAAAALGIEHESAAFAWGKRVLLRPAAGKVGAPGAGDVAEPGGAGAPILLGDDRLDLLEPRPLSRSRPPPSLGLFRRALLTVADPRLVVLVAAVAALLVISTVVFHSAPGLYPGAARSTVGSWIDALLFTVTTAYGNT